MLRRKTGAVALLPALVAITAACVTGTPARAARPTRYVAIARDAATAPRRALTYGGSLSTDAPFAIQVARDRAHLARVLFRVAAKCASGVNAIQTGAVPFQATKGTGDENRFYPDRLGRTGSFKATGTATALYGDAYGVITEALAGRLKGNVGRGTLRVSIKVFEMNTGAPITTCDTGALTWHAEAAPGKVFAGLTAGGEPVVVETSADRLRIAHLRLGWSAPCQPDGEVSFPEHFRGGLIDTTGNFGGSIDSGPYTDSSDGSSTMFHYDIHGRLGKTSASGTFAAAMTHQTADGTQDGSCTLPAERWKAVS